MGLEKNYGYSYGVTGIKVSYKKSIVKKKKEKEKRNLLYFKEI